MPSDTTEYTEKVLYPAATDRLVNYSDRLGVLSAPPAEALHRGLFVIGAAIVPTLITSLMLTGAWHPEIRVDTITIELIQLSPSSVTEPTASAEPSQASAPADPAKPLPEPQETAAAPQRPAPPDPTPSPADVARPPSVSTSARQSTVHRSAVHAASRSNPVTAASNAEDHHPAETLTGYIRAAVQLAVRCPAVAKMMGQSGKAGVAFDYRDGIMLGEGHLAQSSGIRVLDAAALTAVRNAHYPEPPPEVANQVLHLLVWIQEDCGD